MYFNYENEKMDVKELQLNLFELTNIPSSIQNIIDSNNSVRLEKCTDTCEELIPNTNKYTIKKDEIEIPDKNKYIIIHLQRSTFVEQKNVPVGISIDISRTMKICEIEYRLLSCILNTHNGHYIYTTFDKDGGVHKTYDDRSISEKSISKEFILEKNSYVLLYYRINSLVNTVPPELLLKSSSTKSTFHPNIPTYYSLSLSDSYS